MKIKKYILILGLMIFLMGFANAEDSYVKRVYGSCSSFGSQDNPAGYMSGEKSINFDYMGDVLTGKDSPFFNSQDFGILTDVRGGEIHESYIKPPSAGGSSSSDFSQLCLAQEGGCPQYGSWSSGSGWSKGVYTGAWGFLEYGCLEQTCNYFVSDFKQRVASTIECDCNKVTYSYTGEYGAGDNPDWYCSADIQYTEIWSGKPIVPEGVVCEPCGEVEIGFQESYYLDTQKTRGFTPKKPINIYDKIVCKEIITVPRGLGKEEASNFIDDIFKLFEKASAKFIVVDDKGAEVSEIASTTSLEFSIKDSVVDKKIVFVWDINGLKDSWTFDIDVMEKIVSNQKVDCIINFGGFEERLNNPEPTSNCVRIAGPDGITKDKQGKVVPAADISFVFMNDGMGGDNPFFHVDEAKKFYDQLLKTDPFGYKDPSKGIDYSKNIAYFVGLKSIGSPVGFGRSGCEKGNVNLIYDDSFIMKEDERIRNEPGIDMKENEHVLGFSVPGTGLVYLSSVIPEKYIVHEVVHSLCNAQDEATRYTIAGKLPREINCRLDGSSFAPYGGSIAGCTYPNYFKSSSDSLMNYGESKKLNLITAGYCLNAINKCSLKKEDANNCWELSKNMDVIKPTA